MSLKGTVESMIVSGGITTNSFFQVIQSTLTYHSVSINLHPPFRRSWHQTKGGFSVATSPSPRIVDGAPSPIGNERIGILVADDTPMGCHLLEAALKRSHHNFQVLACAVSRPELLGSITGQRVDVALINEDLQEGRLTGLLSLRELHDSHPDTHFVLLCKSLSDDLVVDAFRAGATGIFCRTETFGRLCKCIQVVNRGQVWADSVQLRLMLGALKKASPLRVVSSSGPNPLTKREAQVVNLLTDGHTNREIALKLGISEHTVSNYLFRIYNKLGISSRVELVLYVMNHREEGRWLDRAV